MSVLSERKAYAMKSAKWRNHLMFEFMTLSDGACVSRCAICGAWLRVRGNVSRDEDAIWGSAYSKDCPVDKKYVL
jgi:hypothetical protein